MKRFVIILICLFSTFREQAQLTDSLQVQLARKWVNSKVYALKLAALMPEENYDFRASPEDMTFRDFDVQSFFTQTNAFSVHSGLV